MNICAVRLVADLMYRYQQRAHEAPEDPHTPIPHESDGDKFRVVKLVPLPLEDNLLHFREDEIQESEFRCKHCGAMFMEDQ